MLSKADAFSLGFGSACLKPWTLVKPITSQQQSRDSMLGAVRGAGRDAEDQSLPSQGCLPGTGKTET